MAVVDLVTFIVIILASMRITRIVRWDEIGRPLREHWAKKSDESTAAHQLAYALHCHRCISVYTGVAAAALAAVPAALWPGNLVALIPAVGLAASEIGILIHDRTEES